MKSVRNVRLPGQGKGSATSASHSGGDASALGEGGRIVRRKRATRARLREAAYEVISEIGVDAAKIKDITDRADVGFGTFYNYFTTKDDLANQVLDCVIYDFGRRNVIATRALRKQDPALVMPVSIRLVIREAMQTPMWQWWALRPDLLFNRMRTGFRPFATRDMQDGLDRGIFRFESENIDTAWALSVWMMVGGIHDVVIGDQPLESEIFVVTSIMQMMGVPIDVAKKISSTALPQYPPAAIDWNFELGASSPQPALTRG